MELALAADASADGLPSPTDPTLSLASAPTIGGASESSAVAPRHARPAFAAGDRLGPYRIDRLLGSGGFGEVWEAEDSRDQRRIALKLLTEDLGEAARQRFRREGRIAASIDHPRVVFLFAAEELDGVPALAMELLPGGTLKELVEKRGPLPWREAVERILEIVAGLEAARARGILHRDVKPSNCFLDEHGRVKVGDFGLSIPTEGGDDHTKTGTYVGTPAFSSPEQVRGAPLDVRSDLFSLGATLYYLLSARVPFGEGSLGQVLARVLAEDPAPLATTLALPPGLERAVRRLMAKSPRERPASYADVQALLVPYSRRRLGAADFGLRLVANWVDDLVVAAGVWSVLLLSGVASRFASRPDSLARAAASAAIFFAYYVLFERRFGRTPGKAIFGLAVRAADGAPITTRAAIVRSAVFVAGMTASPALASLALPGRPWIAFGLNLLVAVALFAPMRRATGFRGLHELLSDTRVTREPRRLPAHRALVATLAGRRPPATPAPDLPARLGPFEIEGALARRPESLLLLGHDRVLRRAVWIVLGSDPTELADSELEPASGGLRLWRLQSGRHGATRWHAYLALEGASIFEWVASAGPRSWAEASGVLVQLANALEGTSGEPVSISLGSLWVTPRLELRRLPFEAPGGPAAIGDERRVRRDWRELVLEVAIWLLEARSAEPGGHVPQRPLPTVYREALDRLGSGRTTSPRELAEDLTGLPKLPTELSRARRIVALGLSCLPILACALVILEKRSYDLEAPGLDGFRSWISLAMLSLSLPALLALVFPPLLSSGGLSLHLAGIAVVRRDGARAGRVRQLLRAAVAWSPVLVAFWTPVGGWWLAPPALALFFGGALLAVVRPIRGLQDRIAGTALVPRS